MAKHPHAKRMATQDLLVVTATRVAVLADGKIAVVGWPEEVITDTVLSTLYNTRIRVMHVAVSEPDTALVHVCVPMMHS